MTTKKRLMLSYSPKILKKFVVNCKKIGLNNKRIYKFLCKPKIT